MKLHFDKKIIDSWLGVIIVIQNVVTTLDRQ